MSALVRELRQEVARLTEEYAPEAVDRRIAEVRRECMKEVQTLRFQLKRLQLDRRAQGKHDSVVYFMDFGDTVKIGRSSNIRRRVEALKPVRVLATVAGDSDDEAALHSTFEHLRTRVEGNGGTEHFRKGPELLDYIATLEGQKVAA